MNFKSLNSAIRSVTNPQSKLVEEQRYIEEYIELLEFALEAIAEELECDVEDLLEDLPPKSYVDRITKKTKDAQKKKFASSQSAYVKSTNNRTDSKGKKLDPYDDYQS